MAKATTRKPAKAKAAKAVAAPSVLAFAFDGATITSNIARIKANDDAQQKLVHQTALMCVAQIMTHRNTDYISRLLNGLGKGWRKTSLVKWAEHFMPVKLTVKRDKEAGTEERKFQVAKEDDKRWIELKGKFDADPVKFCDLPTFWDFDPEVLDIKPINFLAIIEAAVKRADDPKYPKGHPNAGEPLSAEDKAKCDFRGLAQAKALLKTLKGSVSSETSSARH